MPYQASVTPLFTASRSIGVSGPSRWSKYATPRTYMWRSALLLTPNRLCSFLATHYRYAPTRCFMLPACCAISKSRISKLKSNLHDPRKHARQRRANAHRVASRSRLRSPHKSDNFSGKIIGRKWHFGRDIRTDEKNCSCGRCCSAADLGRGCSAI